MSATDLQDSPDNSTETLPGQMLGEAHLRAPLHQERDVCIAAHDAILDVAGQCNIALRLLASNPDAAAMPMIDAEPMLRNAISLLRSLNLSRMAPANGRAA